VGALAAAEVDDDVVGSGERIHPEVEGYGSIDVGEPAEAGFGVEALLQGVSHEMGLRAARIMDCYFTRR
jgi:hypothetical protein